MKLATLKLDINKQGSELRKQIERLQWQIKNDVLTKKLSDKKQDEIDQLEKQIKASESQLTPLQVTKVIHITHK